jgi:hypothetical protein
MSIAFIPGKTVEQDAPLARYLPPLPEGIVQTWLKANIPRGSWILDPFGASPQLDIEIARSGYRALTAVNNPILQFLLKMETRMITEKDMRAALAELASLRKGADRLERYIQSLYETECAVCGKTIPAESYLWERGAKVPNARIYHCPHCGDEGEYPTTQTDWDRLEYLNRGAMHRARAMERVISSEDPDRENVEEALNCYLNRPLYALFTLINKLDGAQISPETRNLLTAMLLSTCDAANTLWPYPVARSRPRQLIIPPHFKEYNLWFSMERSMNQWQSPDSPVPLTYWPDQPNASGGICLFRGRLKDLATRLNEIPIGAVVTAIPRINQAFWTLSALWAGWLWGKEAVQPFKGILSRRRYDWNWHTNALASTLHYLQTSLKEDTLCFALLCEVEAPFLTAVLTAAQWNKFTLRGIALRSEQAAAQITWKRTDPPPAPSQPLADLILAAAQNDLKKRGEPARYLQIYSAVLEKLAQEGALPERDDSAEQLPIPHLQTTVDKNLKNIEHFIRYEGSEHTLETGQWWLVCPPEKTIPLMDQVEMEIVRRVQKNPGITLTELDESLCNMFRGTHTPQLSYIKICLESYAERLTDQPECWQLRAEDLPHARREDLQMFTNLLHEIGERLHYKTNGDLPLLWINENDDVNYAYYIVASAMVSQYMLESAYPPEKSIIVLPGGRANLLATKIDNDARLSACVNAGWRFLKFRHLRHLAENPLLTRSIWDKQINSDPLVRVTSQMALL